MGSVKVRGRICQYRWPDASRKSINRRAHGPKSPMPKGEGSEVIWRRIPPALIFMFGS
jgi:hypothetical protein